MKKIITKKLLKNIESKNILQNFSYLLIMKITGYIFPLLTLPYLARVIGPDGFGKIAFAAAIVLWFESVTTWGFNYTAVRDIARNRSNISEVSRFFSNVFWSKVLLMSISFIVLCILVVSIPYMYEIRYLIFITFLIIPGKIVYTDWLFQALEDMKYITIFDFFIKLAFTVSVFIFVKEKSDYILQPLFMALGYLVSGIVTSYLIKRKWSIKLQRVEFKSICDTIIESKDAFIASFAPNLYNGFSVMLLGHMHGTVLVGLLDAGKRFMLITTSFLNLIARVYFPLLSRKLDKHKSYELLSIGTSSIMALILFVLSSHIINYFYTPDFESSITILKIFSFSVIFLTMRDVYGINYLMINGCEKYMRNTMLITSIFGMLLAIILVNYFGAYGAALTITIIHGVQALFLMLKAKNHGFNSK